MFTEQQDVTMMAANVEEAAKEEVTVEVFSNDEESIEKSCVYMEYADQEEEKDIGGETFNVTDRESCFHEWYQEISPGQQHLP